MRNVKGKVDKEGATEGRKKRIGKSANARRKNYLR
jgi:hypothetical protein